MKNLLGLRGLSYVAVAFFMFLASCSDNNKIDFTANDATNLEGESTSDAFATDVSDVSTDVVGSLNDSQLGGRLETDTTLRFLDNDRLKCATSIVMARTGTKNNPAGTITIIYPSGGDCADARGLIRHGKVIINYTGKRFAVDSKIIITFDNYIVSGVKVEGTITLKNVTPSNAAFPRFNITIVGGKVTFLNGKTITRAQDLTREWQRNADPGKDKWVLLAGGTASGTNREGRDYVMQVASDVVFSRACWLSNKTFIPVSGEKTFTSDNKKMSINFGTGTCDNFVTITINGKSRDVEIKGDGN